jgi:hypothetical protein
VQRRRTTPYLILHEEVEKTLIEQLNLHYLHAHQIATRVPPASGGAATTASCRNTSSVSATSG